jgi:hypothetical protein
MVKLGGCRAWAAWLVAVAAVSGCSHDVSLKFPDSSPGEEYVCSPTARNGEQCVAQTKVDPAKDNRAGTVFVIVPRECQGKFNEITIHDAGSAKPVVNVKCAPLENKLE